jgi:tRNA pseudouridine55 synthase
MGKTEKPVASGLLLLHKKPGLTSFEALGPVKRALGSGKAGHTGTLDKFAQGLLLILTGRALKLSPWFTHCDKRYEGTICFGIETATLDPEGEIIARAGLPSREAVEKALPLFTGDILQSPPAYSAIHIDGKRASALARSGEAPEMKKRPVSIYGLELLSWEPPFARIGVHCSGGTYIRSLARDIGLAAGSRAYLSALTRTVVGGFSLEEAFSEPAPEAAESAAAYIQALRPIDKEVIQRIGLPWCDLEAQYVEKIIHGKPISQILGQAAFFSSGEGKTSTFGQGAEPAAVFCGGKFAAIVEKALDKNGDPSWRYAYVYAREQDRVYADY